MKKRFNPKPDITAYELALIYGNLMLGETKPLLKQDVLFTEGLWADTPEGVRRHFDDA